MKIPKHIEIRDKNGIRTAFLSPKADGLKDCFIDQRLNAENTLGFLLPMDSTKWAELTAECKIIAGGREYVILKPNSIEIERDNQNKLMGRVAAAESWILLDKVYPTISNDPQNPDPPDLTVSIISGGTPAAGQLVGTAANALTYLLAGTGWTLDVCDVDGVHDLEGEKLSVLAYIRRVQETWGGLLIWDSLNKKLSLRSEEWQPFNGFQVRYAKNLRHITKSVDNDIVTRIYPFGENDLDIASVNNGVKYLENFSFTNTVYEGIFRDQTIHEPADLKAAAERVLDKLCRPRNTYRVRVADLRMLAEYRHESFALAHMADVVDEEVAGTTRVRIVRHRYNVFEPWNCELEIGEPEDRLEARLADSFDVSSKVKTNVLPNPSFAELLKGIIDTHTTTINGARGKLVWGGDRIDAIAVDAQGVETGQVVRITPGGIGVSDDFGQTFRTAMTGAGIVADEVTTGRIRTNLVEIFGDAHFRWDGSNLYVIDPANTQHQIRLGKFDGTNYGIAFTRDGGATWTARITPDGKIYGMDFQSGGVGATSFVRIGAGASPLEVYQDNKRSVELWGTSFGGYMVFYDTTGATAVLQGEIAASQGSTGGLTIRGRAAAGGGLPLWLQGSYVDLTAAYIYLQGTNGGNSADVTVWGNFYVTGDKSALQHTDNYGSRALYARESPESRFVDEGIAEIVGGSCVVELDPVFLECIEPDTADTPWLAHVTPYFPGSIYVAEVTATHITIAAHNPEASGPFTWSLSGIRKGYAGVRLEEIPDELLTNELLADGWEDELLEGVV